MSDLGQETSPATEEQPYLRRRLRRIIVGQENRPRAPGRQATWKRTLFSFAARLDRLSSKSPDRGQTS